MRGSTAESGILLWGRGSGIRGRDRGETSETKRRERVTPAAGRIEEEGRKKRRLPEEAGRDATPQQPAGGTGQDRTEENRRRAGDQARDRRVRRERQGGGQRGKEEARLVHVNMRDLMRD